MDIDVYNFELKENVLNPDPNWTKERREKYLIVPEVYKIKSVDNICWLDCFDLDLAKGIRISRPIHADYFRSVKELVDIIKTFDPTILNLITPVGFWYEDHSTASPEYMNKFIGYDVADLFSLSGILNFGRDSETMSLLRDKYKNDFNEFHLFTCYEKAKEFSQYMDSRAIEHAPFGPVAIFELDYDILFKLDLSK